jgi:uncharacterized OB-fold protein
MPEQRTISAPVPDPETKPFWDAAVEGKLLLKRCRACGEPYFYPRALCPFCLSADTEWITASGAGVIYTYSVMRRGPSQYAIAYVTLAEGVTMMTNIVDCEFDRLRIGMPVRVVFRPSDGGPPVPMFAPA